MGKYADRYFKIEPWAIVEEGFNPEYAQVSESIFSLGNEYMGLRGNFEEGYSGESLQGSYINGIYESRKVQKSGYRGMIDDTEFMVNTVDWTAVKIECGGVKLDLFQSQITSFERRLDLSNAVLTRRFIWKVDADTEVLLTFERFLSMTRPDIAGQRIDFKCLKGTANLSVEMSLDFSRLHESLGVNLWHCKDRVTGDDHLSITGTTHTTGQTVKATCLLSETGKKTESLALNSKAVGVQYDFSLDAGASHRLERLVCIEKIASNENFASDENTATVEHTATDDKNAVTDTVHTQNAVYRLSALDYEACKQESAKWWAKQWQLSDIQIEGDEENQQGIRFCIFQMHQTLHTADHTAVIGAKGLTGEAYNGNTFWDTEVYCLPFYLFNNPKAAKNILEFRYDTLPEARARAKALDLNGAFYPIATISGKECCDLWQHASLQMQASTGVMYGIWNYVNMTGDTVFLYDKGIEMLVEICRMLASRGDFSPVTKKYGYYGVMGPDEFQMMVNNNAYTNYMAKKTFEYTLAVLEQMKLEDAEHHTNRLDTVMAKLFLTPDEPKDWQLKAESMALPYYEDSMLFEQHDGYFNLPVVKLDEIPVAEFPLYSHWSYERIYRNSMLKQPDVLMFMLLFNSDFSLETLKANFDFYEPRCIHESSLSPSVHSILASQLGKSDLAYQFFGFATRMDLDNYNRNTKEGLHTTSISGSWMNIVYGFGGLRSDTSQLSLSPTIPAVWDRYQFKLQVKGVVLDIAISRDAVTLSCEGGELSLKLYDEVVTVGSAKVRRPLRG